MLKLSLFGLNTSREYAQKVAAHLSVELQSHEERDFQDGEHKCRALADVYDHDVYVVSSMYGEPSHSVNDKLCRLLFFIGALRDAGAARVTAVMPYLCYARKDQRTQPNDPVTTRYVAALFEAVDTHRVATIDVHNIAAYENAFRCHASHLKAASIFVNYFREMVSEQETVIVAPDFGGAKRAEEFRRDLSAASGRRLELAVMEKYRAGGLLQGSALIGNVRGKTAIIFDDLISSGSTLRRAAHACRAAGAINVYAVATHGLFMPGSSELLTDQAITHILVSDTVSPLNIDISRYGSSLQILDSSKIISDAVMLWNELL